MICCHGDTQIREGRASRNARDYPLPGTPVTSRTLAVWNPCYRPYSIDILYSRRDWGPREITSLFNGLKVEPNSFKLPSSPEGSLLPLRAETERERETAWFFIEWKLFCLLCCCTEDKDSHLLPQEQGPLEQPKANLQVQNFLNPGSLTEAQVSSPDSKVVWF